MENIDTKEFEMIATKLDPIYSSLVAAIEIVKEFIIERKLILYGGTMIDFALRMHGDHIYSDDTLAIPDLDFYSPNNISDAYDLADILYKRGYKYVRVIRAIHLTTMKVDLVDNHFIADITYRDPRVFAEMPYITYAGMRITHPNIQKIDMHSALSFPMDNPPREAVFERWYKDVKRYNLLSKYYPTAPEVAPGPLSTVATIPTAVKPILTGLAAYAVLFTEFKKIADANHRAYSDVLPAVYKNDGEWITVSTAGDIETIHMDIVKAANRLAQSGQSGPSSATVDATVAYYFPYGSYLPKRAEVSSQQVYTIYSTRNKLIGINVIKSHHNIRVTNVQYTLRILLGRAYAASGKQRDMYLAHYASILRMIAVVEDIISTLTPDAQEEHMSRSIFYPSLYMYGNENRSLAYEVMYGRISSVLFKTPEVVGPQNYKPDSVLRDDADPGATRPTFDYALNAAFNESGAICTTGPAADTS